MSHAVYIHIPFCEQICHYCDFNKVFIKNQPVEKYLAALEKEIQHRFEKNPPSSIKTVYIGGGTPTALDELMLTQLLSIIKNQIGPFFVKDIEYTVEANPGGNLENKLAILREFGVNRISLGTQAFQDHLLKSLGRIHNKTDIENSVNEAKRQGFDRINIDLMFGLPNQSMDDFKASIDEAIKLNVDHISAYSLQIEPKTYFYILQNKGKLKAANEDDEAAMYQELISRLNSANIFQYEISNFAKPGFESKHNLTYWNNEEYYGFGAGAHGYINGARYYNISPINKYMDAVLQLGHGIYEENSLTKNNKMEEEMFLGLRKLAGINKSDFYGKYSVSVSDVFGENIKDLLKRGLIVEDSNQIKLSKNGLFLGNEVFQSFLLE